MAKAKAPVVKKTAKPIVKARVRAPIKKATTIATQSVKPVKQTVSLEQRWKLVAEAAYYFAEKRHFAHGHSVADWLAAERQVDARLNS